eukprot:2616751-Rhodomonas_salina.1
MQATAIAVPTAAHARTYLMAVPPLGQATCPPPRTGGTWFCNGFRYPCLTTSRATSTTVQGLTVQGPESLVLAGSRV